MRSKFVRFRMTSVADDGHSYAVQLRGCSGTSGGITNAALGHADLGCDMRPIPRPLDHSVIATAVVVTLRFCAIQIGDARIGTDPLGRRLSSQVAYGPR